MNDISDEYILSKYYIKDKINKNATRHIQKYKHVIEYLNNRYVENRNPIDYTEIIYRIKHNVEEIPKCPICGKFKKYRTCHGPYNDKTCGNKECQYSYMENTFIKRYGGYSGFGNEITKQKIENTINEKYEAFNIMQSNKFINNHKFKYISKEEEIIGNILKTLYKDVLFQYKSNEYQHRVDFYIPELKLYIEYNGSYYHHGHIFNPNNKDDIEELNRLNIKNQNECIKTWTISDIQKLSDAKNNNLNYLVIYPLFLDNSRNAMRKIFKENKQQIRDFLYEYIETNYRNKCKILKVIGEDK